MPIDYKLYPENWDQICQHIAQRAGHCCQDCGAANEAIGYYARTKFFVNDTLLAKVEEQLAADVPIRRALKAASTPTAKLVRIACAVAHLDQDIANNDYGNLRYLCQRCHLRQDLPTNVSKRYYGKHFTSEGQARLFHQNVKADENQVAED